MVKEDALTKRQKLKTLVLEQFPRYDVKVYRYHDDIVRIDPTHFMWYNHHVHPNIEWLSHRDNSGILVWYHEFGVSNGHHCTTQFKTYKRPPVPPNYWSSPRKTDDNHFIIAEGHYQGIEGVWMLARSGPEARPPWQAPDDAPRHEGYHDLKGATIDEIKKYINSTTNGVRHRSRRLARLGAIETNDLAAFVENATANCNTGF